MSSSTGSLRTTLICQIVLGLLFPLASFVCGIVLLARSGSAGWSRGLVVATGVLALFWFPIITTVMAAVALTDT